MKKRETDIYVQWLIHAVILIYGISMVYLYYKQTQWTSGSVFESDLPAHIKMVIEDGWYYSITAFVYRILYFLPFADLAIAIFLSLCSVASIYATSWLLYITMGKNVINQQQEAAHNMFTKKSFFLIFGVFLNIVMPCYIRGFADGRYIGMQSASIWHNSTYIVMKWLGIFSLIAYFKIETEIKDKLSVKSWLAFMLLLAMTTGAKPSFLLVFAPVMLIFLIIDLFVHKISFKRLFILGCAVLPSLGVILLQNAILFSDDASNGWSICPGVAISQHSGYPAISAILSILFPIIVLCVNFQSLKKDRWFLTAWLIAIVGFLELFLFCETGTRVNDGNFMWGYSFAILIIFVASVAKWFENLRTMWKSTLLKVVYVCITGLIFIWHVDCGVYFYIHLLQGVSYWMWG